MRRIGLHCRVENSSAGDSVLRDCARYPRAEQGVDLAEDLGAGGFLIEVRTFHSIS
jgi:hypothetical protein